MIRRFELIAAGALAASLLSGCLTTSSVKQRPGVAEAKACMRVLKNNPAAIKGYVVRACTNTGVWLVDRVDPDGFTLQQYDFVNRDYSGPETGFGFVPVESLGDDVIRSYKDLHKTLNKDLKESAEGK
jgi:hypothetical protein